MRENESSCSKNRIGALGRKEKDAVRRKELVTGKGKWRFSEMKWMGVVGRKIKL